MTHRGRTPLVTLALFRYHRFKAGIITNLLSSALFWSLLFLLPFYLQTILLLTPLQAGFVFATSGISFIIASSFSQAIMKWLGYKGLPGVTAQVAQGYLLIPWEHPG